MIDASRRALPGRIQRPMARCGSQSIANYRKREAELLFALVGDARSLLFPVAVAPHPTRVLEGIEQFSRSGSQRHGDLDEPRLPRQVHRVTPCRARVSQTR